MGVGYAAGYEQVAAQRLVAAAHVTAPQHAAKRFLKQSHHGLSGVRGVAAAAASH